jgi:hypothetical protein
VDVELAVEALCRNGSGPALDLMGRILKDTEHPLATRLDWVHRHLLAVRRSDAFLERVEGWIFDVGFERGIRAALAETVFDYRPSEWYRSTEAIPRPPAEEGVSEAARALLQRVGRRVAAGDFTEETQAAARRASVAPANVKPDQ